MRRGDLVSKQALDTELNVCPKCGMFSGVRVMIRKGAQEWVLVRCQQCKAQTKRYEYFPAATRAWNKGMLEVTNENEKSAQA